MRIVLKLHDQVITTFFTFSFDDRHKGFYKRIEIQDRLDEFDKQVNKMQADF